MSISIFNTEKPCCGSGIPFAKSPEKFIYNEKTCRDMRVKAEAMINWVDSNLPPLAWRIIVMKQMKVLLKYKISPAKIDADTYFSAEIVEAIRVTIKVEYNKDLPSLYI